eukprot:CAMPEP_0118865142 /NCGR_PEP_ID=MMETSP1163-20130328/9499_1 /TAXON_ID=124430 /ORGANISM="Phaeomonas parva, Strain CCMP2877" /LENGTH=525 /DNA_ID=CAMNT_0006799341 /DNA_START=97 /DNA_END=1670 /DNA_ORIENTATION=-
MLQYDDTGAAFFAITLLTFYLIPATYVVVTRLRDYVSPNPAVGPDFNARTETEKEKARTIAKKLAQERVNNSFFVLLVVSTVMLWMLTFYLLSIVSEGGEIKQFDPFAILGVTASASEAEIKKAYRKMSLQYHPDKNPGNKQAENMFMMVAKAYGALTDPEARENWEKYGNPDGKQSLELSVGLPQWLIEKDNHNLILVLYLVALVVIIPLIVGCWYSQSKKYGEKGVMYQTYHRFMRSLNPNVTAKMLPEVLALAEEFREVNSPNMSRAEEMNALFQRFQKEMPRIRTKDELTQLQLAIVQKGMLLLAAHLNDAEVGPMLQQDLRKMLSATPELANALVEICASRRWWNATCAAIDFQQCLTQGIWPPATSALKAPFLQLPNFTMAEVSHVFSGKGQKAKSFADYLALPDDAKKGLARMTDTAREECLEVAGALPRVKLSCRAFVQDEAEIAEGDLVTLRIKIVRENIAPSLWDDEESDDEGPLDFYESDDEDDAAGDADSDDDDAVLVAKPKDGDEAKAELTG